VFCALDFYFKQFWADVPEQGNLYFVSGLIEQQSKSYAVRKMDPWPLWQVIYGRL
jgi:hypothetical protein